MSYLDNLVQTVTQAKYADKADTQATYVLAQTLIGVTKAVLLELDIIGDQLERLADNVETLRRTIAQK